MRISLVTPLYRSEPHIEELYTRTVATITKITDDYEIVLVNDGSPDGSLAVAKRLADQDPKVKVIDLSRNFGQHRALMTGLKAATGDYIFICDSDLEEEPEWIALFYEMMQGRDCDVVYGVQSARKRGPIYRFWRFVFYKVLNFLSDAHFPENVITARLLSRRYLDAMLEYGERELFLAGVWHMVGFVQLPSPVNKMDTSPTTYSIGRLASIFINAVTAFSTRPLQTISVAGIALCFVAFIFFVYVICQKLFFDTGATGWTSLIATQLLMGGLILFFNGVMAIYIAKIFVEVKQRPMATIREVYRPQIHDGDGPDKPPAAAENLARSDVEASS